MTPEDQYQVPFETDESATETDSIDSQMPSDANEVDQGQYADLARPFVGRWNELISTTNWEKGRIIFQWRQALIESGADAQQYSDQAWAQRVGGVTAPHVGRLRRVYERFESTYESYEGLYWTHFLAALDWDDAPLWLEGASREGWSVSAMREKRWQAHGAVDSQRPTESEIISVDTDEDVVLPAQGGGRTREYDEQAGVSSGPKVEEPDFGEDEELMSLSSGAAPATNVSTQEEQGSDTVGIDADPVQPFAGLPELPDDLADAVETLKLAILRQKSAGWTDVQPDVIHRYLKAIEVLIDS